MNDAVLSNKKQGTPADDMLLTFLMTFAFAAYSYEARLDDGILSLLKPVLLAVFMLTWIITAAKNGINRKPAFAVYCGVYWLIPQLIILLFYQGPEILRHSVIMYTLSEFSALLTTRPAELLGGYFGLNAQMSLIIFLLIVFGSFFTGSAYINGKENQNKQG